MSTPFISRMRLASVALLTACGCYAYNPYGMPPGYQPYPPAGPPQMGGVPSSFTYTSDVAHHPATREAYIPQSSLEAPHGTAPQSSGDTNPVPVPRDPGQDAAARPANGQTSFVTPSQVPRSVLGAPSNSHLPTAQSGPLQPVPARQSVARTSQPAGSTGGQIVAASLEQDASADKAAGFDHDPGYRWFQGILEYDPNDRNWHLLYTLSPSLTDQLGGEITLSGNMRLQQADSGKLFRVHGVFDTAQLDRLKKPVYRVTGMQRINAAH